MNPTSLAFRLFGMPFTSSMLYPQGRGGDGGYIGAQIGSCHRSANKHSRQTVMITGTGTDRIDFAPVYCAGAIGKVQSLTRAQFFRAYH